VLKARKGQSLGTVLGTHGGKREKGKQGSERTLKRGETVDYLARRLRRDRPCRCRAARRLTPRLLNRRRRNGASADLTPWSIVNNFFAMAIC